ncbi:hypothetical protein LTS03_005659 [Exophiala xenobiotica]|nr:hypothetical protein LTR41_002338 [Exophiala xenobiotica]KAK5217774.1 hypothetical protein LTR72_009437 [Exophiala xenobiotica]KAK5254370.1 hypothetical protein LTS06_001204 [Exophiala xenobiotica]KAK5260679.1 hypothetical protein LTR40_003709 [Exophiala xenobiotica]KAK5291948.1 hypothetical protein LTR14_005497 [Exophiala xenobiotica]
MSLWALGAATPRAYMHRKAYASATMTEITVNGNVIPPSTQQEGGSHFAIDASRSNYLLVHCVDRLIDKQYDILRRLKVDVLQYAADNTYLCRFLPAELDEIRRLDFVVFANVYHSDLVINAILKSKVASVEDRSDAEKAAADQKTSKYTGSRVPDQGSYEAYVVLHPECGRSAADVKDQLIEMLGIESDEIFAGDRRLILNLRARDLSKIAALDEVQTIEELPAHMWHNEIARGDLGIPVQSSGGVVAGSADGEKIAVADSGVDIKHPAFTAAINAHPSRLTWISYRTLHATSAPVLDSDKEQVLDDSDNPVEQDFPDWETVDFSGHGTHIAGSLIGQYDSTRFGPIRGTAPDASIVMQVTEEFNTQSCMPRKKNAGGLEPMLQKAYDEGARLHSDSWGAPPSPPPDGQLTYTQLGYNQDAIDFDQFMKDKGNFLILCSAGNSGHLKTKAPGGQVGVHSSCKNVITVGSTQSSRRYLRSGSNSLISDPGGTIYGDPTKAYYTSSRGPTLDGRIKPDVLGPGLGICSTRSGVGPYLSWDGGKPLNHFGNIIIDGVDQDMNLIYSSGTSMATPLVAGCCAVIRKALRTAVASSPEPPAALIKAILVNGAVDVRGFESVGLAPDPSLGFGLVNVEKSLLSVQKTTVGGFWPRVPTRLGTGATTLHSTSSKVPLPPAPDDPTVPPGNPPAKMMLIFSATMCYNDAVGTTGALVNVLNLKVTVSDGSFKYGNTQSTTKDSKNNVQKVVWVDIKGPWVDLNVTCDNLGPSQETQDFYVAYRFDFRPTAHSDVWDSINRYMSLAQAISAFNVFAPR